jgi:leader peptidase (prepilin peptidase)/N-methyltransferase
VLRPIAIAIAAGAASLAASPDREGVCGAGLAILMIAIAAIDARRYMIPNALVAAAAALGLVRAGLILPNAGIEALAWGVIRAVAVALPLWALMAGYRWWRGRDGLGFGDVKLAAVAGLWLDWVTIFAVVELAALSGIAAYAIGGWLRGRPLRGTAFLPFGLFLAPAIWIGWLAETLLYRGMFG